MDAVEFLNQYSRMVASGVQPFSIPSNLPPEEIVERVEQWAKEHPVKTRQSEFLKQWPDARLYEGVLGICPAKLSSLHRDEIGRCTKDVTFCPDCRRDFWLQEVD